MSASHLSDHYKFARIRKKPEVCLCNYVSHGNLRDERIRVPAASALCSFLNGLDADNLFALTMRDFK
jgi:hypothetical protein